MTLTVRLISEVAAASSLGPLAWLAWLRWRGAVVGAHLMLIASGFAVSWLADTAALAVNPLLPSLVYPLSQALLVTLAFVDRPEPFGKVFRWLVFVAFVALLWESKHHGPDVLLHTVAFGTVTVIVWRRKALGMLRSSLLVSYGVWLVCWWVYVAIRNVSTPVAWASWGAFQSARLVGMVLFCRASLRPGPKLRVA